MIKPVLDQMQVSPGGGSQMFQPDPTPPPPSGATASATSSAGASDQLEAAGKVLAAKVTMVTYNEEQVCYNTDCYVTAGRRMWYGIPNIKVLG